MANRLTLISFLFLVSSLNCIHAADVTRTLYGISLGEDLDSLVGEKSRQIGIVKIKGVETERYSLDTSVYEIDAPFTLLSVQVDKSTGKIIGVMAMTKMPYEECSLASKQLKEKIEISNGLKFAELEHQGDSFYFWEESSSFIALGCQSKQGTVLQYQIGASSLK